MIVGMAVLVTVCSMDASTITRPNAIVTYLRSILAATAGGVSNNVARGWAVVSGAGSTGAVRTGKGVLPKGVNVSIGQKQR
jgi:hypothetical protein